MWSSVDSTKFDHQSLTGTATMLPLPPASPALFTRISAVPNFSFILANSDSTDSGLTASVGTARTCV